MSSHSTSVASPPSWAEYAAREFEPKTRRWPTPGAMAAALDRSVRTTPVLDMIDEALVDVAATLDGHGDTNRLMVFCAPQEGKSEKVSRRFPSWLLAHDPTLRIAIVSYEQGKAERWGRKIRRDIRTHPELCVELMPDSQAVGRWETRQGGGLICAGLQGGITGEPVDVLIIDDPVKGRAEAESLVYRDAAWDWWESNGSTRLSERGVVVLMMTRWHADDLASRLEQREPADWRVLSIPAISLGDGDPLDRPKGEEMPSVRGRQPGYFHELQAKRSTYVFASIYQQHPVAAAGNLFKRGDWQYWSFASAPDDALLSMSLDGSVHALADCFRFITMDLAASTKTSADYTVAVAWALAPSGDLIALDRFRDRVPEEGHAAFLAPLRQRWLGPDDEVYIESRMLGTTLVYEMGRQGVPVAELKADTDKVTRAMGATSLVRQHRIWLPAHAPWLDEWIDEHAEFDKGSHDDQVDNTAYAARVVIVPPVVAEVVYDDDLGYERVSIGPAL